jgi:hypothetical protein
MAQTFDTTFETTIGQYVIIALVLILVVLSALCYLDAIGKTLFPDNKEPSGIRALYTH